jgi:NAD(P)-dependent dehydrogenase (short-subunit alcohol dehydrogenase family)
LNRTTVPAGRTRSREIDESEDPAVKRLDGRTALVTHAAGDIGSAIVAAFAEHGATVIATDSTDERVERAVESLGLQDSIDVVTRSLDVSQLAAWWDLANFVVGFVDELDVLVHSPGVEEKAQAASAESLRMAVDRLHKPLVDAANARDAGSSVIVISPPSADAAVSELAKSMAQEFADAGLNIRVNAIHPGSPREVARAAVQLASGAVIHS